ncbi:4-oxalocrotonate tautomerase, partial [Bradyrhizobium sp.]|uniref:4-oxalocrotonate tautomerase n=1 Tax=Bradyrhizobium sp. TaxID=376 RepID=UPI003C4B421C
MPKMFIHAPRGVFSAEARARVAAELTALGMACERLADTPAIRSGVWVIFTEHEPDTVFSAGQVASHPIIALLVNAIKGGLDDPARKRMIEEGTAILGKHATIDKG